MAPSTSTVEAMFAEAQGHHRAGRLGEAEALYRRILAIQPRHADSLQFLGAIAYQVGRHDLAARLFTAAIEIRDDIAAFHANLAAALFALGRLDEAAARYARALELAPGDVTTLRGYGNVLRTQGRLEGAVLAYERSLSLGPEDSATRYQLANSLRALGRFEAAIEHYERVVEASPDDVLARNSLGVTLQTLRRFDEAARQYQRVAELKPDFAEAYSNLGSVHHAQGRLEDAAAQYRKAISLKPDFAEALCNLGAVVQAQGRLDEAVALFENAIALRPDYATARTSLGFARLLQGDFARGWPDFEWRLRTADFRNKGLAAPDWDGEHLGGRSILIESEQGLGDIIFMARFAPQAHDRGGRVLLTCPAPLHRLFETLEGVAALLPQNGEPPAHDVRSPLMSLPYILGVTPKTIPSRPYLHPDRDLAAQWRDRLRGLDGLKVGVAWRGNPGNYNDRYRSVSAETFASAIDVPGVSIVSLQKDSTPDETAALGRPVFDAGPFLSDFADTAAAIAALDLVVCVDTSVCHLAGALGAPTWTLVPFAPDWRWLLEREDSPWYPSMRLFRPAKLLEWAPVMDRVRATLVELAARAGGVGS